VINKEHNSLDSLSCFCRMTHSVGQRVVQYVLCTLTQRVGELDVEIDQNVAFSARFLGVGQSVALESLGRGRSHDLARQVDGDFLRA
jgi:hypothetical protein